jgi:hypothetical protein
MEIHELWKKAKDQNRQQDAPLLFRNKPMKSQSPYYKLKKSMIWNISAGILFSLLAVGWIFYTPYWEIKLCLIILVFKNLYFDWKLWHILKKFDHIFNHWDYALIGNLRHLLSLMRSTIKTIEWRTVLFLPLAYLTGLMIGQPFSTMPNQDIQVYLVFLLKGMAISLLTLPLFWYTIKWMHKKAFADYVEQMEDKVSQLTEDQFTSEKHYFENL